MSGPQGVQQYMNARQNAAQQYGGINRGAMGGGASPTHLSAAGAQRGPLPTPFNFNLPAQYNPDQFAGMMGGLIDQYYSQMPQGALSNPIAPQSALPNPVAQQFPEQFAQFQNQQISDQINRNLFSGLPGYTTYESAGGGN